MEINVGVYFTRMSQISQNIFYPTKR